MLSVIFLSLLSLTVKIQADEKGVFFKVEENVFLSDENIIWSGKTGSLLACSQTCARQAACKSANFIEKQGSCSLFREGKSSLAEKLLKRDGSFYLEKVNTFCCFKGFLLNIIFNVILMFLFLIIIFEFCSLTTEIFNSLLSILSATT